MEHTSLTLKHIHPLQTSLDPKTSVNPHPGNIIIILFQITLANANKTHIQVCDISESLAMGLADMAQALRETHTFPELHVDAMCYPKIALETSA